MRVLLKIGSISADRTNYKKYLTVFGSNAFVAFNVPDEDVLAMMPEDDRVVLTPRGVANVISQWAEIIDQIDNTRRG